MFRDLCQAKRKLKNISSAVTEVLQLLAVHFQACVLNSYMVSAIQQTFHAHSCTVWPYQSICAEAISLAEERAKQKGDISAVEVKAGFIRIHRCIPCY